MPNYLNKIQRLSGGQVDYDPDWKIYDVTVNGTELGSMHFHQGWWISDFVENGEPTVAKRVFHRTIDDAVKYLKEPKSLKLKQHPNLSSEFYTPAAWETFYKWWTTHTR